MARIAGIITAPVAETSATAEPEIPPNIMLESTVTMPSPPSTRPTAAEAKSTIRSAMPPRCITSPAKTKKGIASKVKMLMPAVICWKATAAGIPS